MLLKEVKSIRKGKVSTLKNNRDESKEKPIRIAKVNKLHKHNQTLRNKVKSVRRYLHET